MRDVARLAQSNPKTTALITGVTGQDGARLAEFLLAKNHVVHGIMRRSSSFNTGRVNHLYHDPHENSDGADFVSVMPSNMFGPGDNYHPENSHVGTGTDITIAELARLIADVVGYSGELILDPSRPDGALRKLLDVSKLNTHGWSDCTPLRLGLERAYEDFVAGGGRGQQRERSN